MLKKLALELIEQYPESIDKLTTYQHVFTDLLWSLFLTYFYEKNVINYLDEEIHGKFSRSAMCWETSGN